MKADWRVFDHERQQVIDALTRHTATGRLTLEEFSGRAELVYRWKRSPTLPRSPPTCRPQSRRCRPAPGPCRRRFGTGVSHVARRRASRGWIGLGPHGQEMAPGGANGDNRMGTGCRSGLVVHQQHHFNRSPLSSQLAVVRLRLDARPDRRRGLSEW